MGESGGEAAGAQSPARAGEPQGWGASEGPSRLVLLSGGHREVRRLGGVVAAMGRGGGHEMREAQGSRDVNGEHWEQTKGSWDANGEHWEHAPSEELDQSLGGADAGGRHSAVGFLVTPQGGRGSSHRGPKQRWWPRRAPRALPLPPPGEGCCAGGSVGRRGGRGDGGRAYER